MLSTAAAVTLILRLAGLINSICTGGGVGLFRLFLEALEAIEALEATELSEATESALFIEVIGSLRLLVYLLAFAFFLDRCCFRTASMEPIEVIIAGDG